jgi:hypothetical protein
MNIVVCGYMIRHPLSGNILAYLHYLIGLQRLGHAVFYLEESGWPASCYDPLQNAYSDSPIVGMEKVGDVFDYFESKIPIYFIARSGRRIFSSVEGTDWGEVKRMLSNADLLINLGGVCFLPEFALCRRRVLIDMDPFFTQTGHFGFKDHMRDYHRHFSYGVNIGQSCCTIPTGGIDWVPTVPPVVMDMWAKPGCSTQKQALRQAVDGCWSTIANWNAYGSVTFSGAHYGQKDGEFLKLLELPLKTSQKFLLALSGAGPEVLDRMNRFGWCVHDGGEVSADLCKYMAFVTGSRGEFSVAKQAYVKTRSGWFSDRSVCYLAAGRPVILQNTGFTQWLAPQAGVMAFSTMDEAIACIDEVNKNYNEHCQGAVEVAQRRFDYRAVLTRLLEIACG